MSVLGNYKWEFKWVLQEHDQPTSQPRLSLFHAHVFL